MKLRQLIALLIFCALPLARGEDFIFNGLFAELGTDRQIIDHGDGTKSWILLQEQTEIHIHFSILGEPIQAETIDLNTGYYLSKEIIRPDRLHTLYYENKTYPTIEVVIGLAKKKKDTLLRWTRYLDEKGNIIEESKFYYPKSGPYFLYDRCLQGVAGLPVTHSTLTLSRQISNVFGSGQTSSSSIRLQNMGCPANYAGKIRQAMTEGMRCMLDPRRGGGRRSRTDVGKLLALMANPSRPFTVKCFPEGGDGVPGHGHVMGVASMCGDHGGSGPNQKAPYPGINLNLATLHSTGRSERSIKGTIYHEMLHTLGYPHGTSPDVSYLCESCCFSATRTSIRNKACSLCREGFSPENSYIGDLAEFTEMSDNQDGSYPEDFLYSSTQLFMSSRFRRATNPQPDIAGQLANEVASHCTGGVSNCGFKQKYLTMVLLYAQKYAQLDDASRPSSQRKGISTLDSVQTSMLSSLETEFNMEKKGMQFIGALMAGYMRGGSANYAKNFLKRSGLCDGLTAQERTDISNNELADFVTFYNVEMYSLIPPGSDGATVNSLCQ